MSKRENKLLILDIKDSCEKIFKYTDSQSFEHFQSDDLTIDAVLRNFTIIGEASNRITEDFKEKYPKISWHQLRGLRNRIVHEYFGVDISTVYDIIQYDLNDLYKEIDNLSKLI